MGETRRKFIRNAALAGASIGLASNFGAMVFAKTIDQNSKLKIDIIGSGLRGPQGSLSPLFIPG